MNRRSAWIAGLAAGMMLGGLVCLSCGENEPAVIAGARLSVTGTPNPVCLNGPSADLTVDITATARDILSAFRPGVTVDFAATNASPTTFSGTTDSVGAVTATLTIPPTVPPSTATVTATAESLVTALAIPVLDTSAHVLASSDTLIDTVCSEGIVLNGTLLDSLGTGVANQVVTFVVITPTSPTGLTGTFSPSAILTGSSGAYTTTFFLNGTLCASSCTLGAGPCSLNVRANVNCINSNEVTITTALP